ncbi:thermonuclease family protein [Sulfitobacter aestuarii]|uniref:Thermonuclease family protein n=1 Tax=Sulfitobacter aestuarii TaxID=2161676 RepID=A0ABW5TZW6_9RHOB
MLMLSAVAVPVSAREGVIHGAIRVIDGDTLAIGKARLRLHGIDAPEAGQPCRDGGGTVLACGDWVTGEVRARFEGRQARCDLRELDRYGRSVAKCYVAGEDVGRLLVQQGLAFAYRRYAMDYDLDEKAAFVAGRGLHGFTLQTPAAYRAAQRATVSDEGSEPPGDCRIKGNISSKGSRIYHRPDQRDYGRTRIETSKGERWFCTAVEAETAGWRAARR